MTTKDDPSGNSDKDKGQDLDSTDTVGHVERELCVEDDDYNGYQLALFHSASK